MNKITILSLLFMTYFIHPQIRPKELLNNDEVRAIFTYKIIFKPDSTNRQIIKKEYGILLAGSTLSKYNTLNKHLLDSTLAAFSNQPIKPGGVINTSSFPITSFTNYIYKNTKTGTITVIDDIGFKNFTYSDKLNNNWNISPEKKNIAGYNCQKATIFFSGRIYEAWFTKEIPISSGPYVFGGLPGLIVKIQDSKGDYMFTITSVKKPAKQEFLELPIGKKYITTTKAEFRKASRYYRENYVDIQLREGHSVYGDPETARQRVRDNNRKRNNPIELAD